MRRWLQNERVVLPAALAVVVVAFVLGVTHTLPGATAGALVIGAMLWLALNAG